MPQIIEPDSALDWLTVYQLCKSAAHELVEANPLEPHRGRIDLFREAIVDGRRYCVRIKLTLVPAGAA